MVQPLSELIDPGWARALAPVEARIRSLGEILRARTAAGQTFLPPGPAILRAFTYPFDQVKVLLLGQDPYPTPGHAVGLSFCVTPETPLPRSLANIFRELHDDLGVPVPSSGDLRPWASQGVMLLNRVLTVSPGQPASHRGLGWEEVTTCAITALTRRGGPLVAILWGREAQQASALLGDTPQICSPHPSPLSAGRGFFGSRPFSRANQLLVAQGATPIDWALPT